ncbi:2-oxoacid:acceptor oxidoreductase family protein [Thermodesulfovibrio yellowstonii]|uniref:Ketoisovalerate oxidoreductase subunit VorA n=1 Tax=Thermodesulfovibrio yellowstonii TaxID=28262 RepID=A0A9W6LKD9_9BACT|nr:2-oxoacid:acceptor oxidoreductase family protein [Thermodesulfovibrio islandicus]GLI53597.1 ketoisovalerate oxidoreductase subunit VorA [Thermodesulfovibrio islandicus]
MEQRIIIVGSGGQGILFLGKVIAHAAMKENKEVTWFPSYGAEMRGGTANCTVVISDELIGSPIVKNADYLIVLNEASYNKFINRVAKNGCLIYDASIIKDSKYQNNINVYPIEASKEASLIANPKLANMILLGAFIKISKILNIEKIIETIEEIIPAKRKTMIEINKNLILRGFAIIED